jgi:hypothetical protein
MSLEIPTPNFEDPNEVFAFYGLAMYSAQVLEDGVLNIAAALHVIETPVISRELFEAVFSKLDLATLGSLLRATRSQVAVDPTLDELLCDALEKRNYLAHRFFREHAFAFTSEHGRAIMIQGLRAMIAVFQAADEALTPLCLKLWARFGVDEAWIEREMAAAMREFKARYCAE